MGLLRVSKRTMRGPLERVRPLFDKEPFDVEAAIAVFKPVRDQLSDFDGEIASTLQSTLERRDFEELSMFWASVSRWRAFHALIYFGLGLLLAGLGLLVFAHDQQQAAAASESWAKTTGTVLDSRVSTHKRGSEGTSRMYYPEVRYSYQAEGKTRKSNRIYIEDGYSSSDERVHAELVARYPKGATIDVYYDPQDPSQAILIPGAPPAGNVLKYFGLALSGLGILALAVFLAYTTTVLLRSAGSARGRGP